MISHNSANHLLKELKATAQYVTFSARYASFKNFVYDKRISAKCGSNQLARAGFYSTVTKESPTSAKCPFCMLELTFEEFNDPWEMHKTQRADCDFVMLGKLDETIITFQEYVHLAIRCSTVAKYEEMLEVINALENSETGKECLIPRDYATRKIVSLRNTSKLLTMDQRLATFENYVHDKKRGNKATSKKLAKAGWFSKASDSSPSSVKCPFCLVKLEFDAADDPWAKHKEFSANCEFVKLGKLDENDWSTEEAIMMAVRVSVMKKYEKGKRIIDEHGNENKFDDLKKQVMEVLKPVRRRCGI